LQKYTIKSYQPGFEIEQEKIGIEVAKSFVFPHQTTAKELKVNYSKPDFDPETRFYCFSGKEMVGFLTSKVLPDIEGQVKKANLTPPSVLKSHESAANLLYEKAIEVLKTKNVKKIETRVGVYSNKSIEDFKKLGYYHAKDTNFLYESNVNSINTKNPTDKVEVFINTRDEAQVIDLIVKNTEQTKEWVKGFFERVKTELKDAVLAHLVIREKEKIIGYALVTRNPIIHSIVSIQQLHGQGPDQIKQLIAKIGQICKQNKITKIFRSVPKKDPTVEKLLTSLGFTFAGASSICEKDL